ncbi:MAG: PhzF family phenazine biosynthesis protein [Paracoccaceae bacterium]|nr:PhzF family phenazine biosynthesis protein [Paracoccaceae bacterium]
MKKRQLEFDWVDAFSTQPFGGNGCVVVHDASEVSIQDRLALVKETSLSECAFLVNSKIADFGARYYLAEAEIPMAGHPTIATVTSLLSRGLVKTTNGSSKFTLEVGSGVLPIEIETTEKGSLIRMTQMAPKFGKFFKKEDISKLYDLEPEDILIDPQIVSTGTPFCVVLLKDKDTLQKAKINSHHFNEYFQKNQKEEKDLMEPFLTTIGGITSNGDIFSRLLMCQSGNQEDPFTGSATGCMAAYLWRHGVIDSPKFVAEQGHWLGRPGSAQVEVLGLENNISGVNVAGYGYVLMSGSLSL